MSDKERLADSIKIHMLRSSCTNDLVNQLKNNGIEAYYRKGELQGFVSERGRKFRMSTLQVEEEMQLFKDNRLIESSEFERAALDEFNELRIKNTELEMDPNIGRQIE